MPLFGSLISPVKLLHDGIPYAIVNAVAQLTHRGDRILLLWLLTDYDLGLYVVAYSAAGVLGNLPLSMGFVSLTIAAQEKPGEGFDRIAKIFRGAVIISFAAGIILSFGVYFLLPLVYGQDFSGARITAILLAAGTILFGLTSLLSQSLKGQGKPMAGMVSRLAGLAAMAVVAFLLHRPLGINGVAIGFVVAQIISLFGIMLLTVQHYQSASLAMMFPRMTDVKTVSLSLKQQGVRLLRKFGIFRTVGGSDSSTPGISSND